MTNIYNMPAVYDSEYRTYTVDIPFLLSLAEQYSGGLPVLEWACGTGRITIPLAQAGNEVTAVDISPEMLGHCWEKITKLNNGISEKITLHQGDMRTFSTGLLHNFAIVPFTAFLHLSSIEDQDMALQNFARHLNPGAHLLVDIFAPSVERLASAVGSMPEFILEKYDPDPDSGTTLVRYHRSTYDSASQKLHWIFKVEIYDTETGELVKGPYIQDAYVTAIWPNEWRRALAMNGFEIVEEWGDFDRSPFSSQSRRMLFLARKK